MITNSAEEYLEAIYRQSEQTGATSTGRLAEALGVAPPSVTTMLRRLAKAGLVAHERYGTVSLTSEGIAAARRVVRRHRIAERVLTDLLGLPWTTVHQHACRLEHVLDGDLEQLAFEKLGCPQFCPHGGLVSAEPVPDTVALAALNVGDEAVVARVTDERPDTLQYLQELGIRPGAIVQVTSRSPAGDLVQLSVGPKGAALGRDVASSIEVLPGDRAETAEQILRDLSAVLVPHHD